MRQTKNMKKQTKQPKQPMISSYSDLKYMDDYSDFPSEQNLQEKSEQQINQILSNKIIKKKSKPQSQSISNNSSIIKRSSAQQGSSKISKPSARKSALFKDLKSQQSQLICKTFAKFSNNYFLGFNQMIMALRSLGLQIQSQRKFQMLKSIFDEGCSTQFGVQFQFFAKLALKLLKQERSQPSSNINIIQKGYYYMIQQGNNIRSSNKYLEEQEQYSSQQNFKKIKQEISSLPEQLKYINYGSLQNVVKYLGLEKQFSKDDIAMVMKHTDQGEKGYLNYQDINRAVSANSTVYL